MQVTNEQFLQAIFGDEWTKAHVTSFHDDPGAIEQDRRGICWAGNSADRWHFEGGENQYFTISLFHKDKGRAVRRREQFDACFVIVADDVDEKLPRHRVEMLPVPSYKLLTSAGSEQWGWILANPCTERGVVTALLDGLVEKGLAPDGTDPGMKGVTRYVRLPGGTNTKASRGNFKCELLSWDPNYQYAIEELAGVFDIDLTPKEEKPLEVDEAPDHPFWGAVSVTGMGGDGWVRIDCPNAAEHTGGDPSGAAARILAGGEVQFKCHHGHCDKLNGSKVVSKLGISEEVGVYQRKVENEGARAMAEKLGLAGGDVGEGEVNEKLIDPKRYIFVAERNKFFDCKTRQLISPVGIDNRYLSIYPRKKGRGASEMLLTGLGLDDEADGFTWKPTGWAKPARKDIVQWVDGQRCINEWSGLKVVPDAEKDYDATPWLKHAEYLFPNEDERNVVLDYLAFTVQRLDEKPSFWIVHRGAHRIGKDLFYQFIMRGMGDNCARTVHIDKLLDGWGDYVRGLRFCIVAEVDKAQDKKVANAMKVICASGASEYRTLNLKGGAVLSQFDCLGGVMMSNKQHCLAVEKGDQRYFVVDSYHERLPDRYYQELAAWRDSGGIEQVIGYLSRRNIEGFNPYALPFETEGLADLIEGGKFDYEQNIDEMVEEKLGIFSNDWFKNAELKAFAKNCGWKCGNNGLTDAVSNAGYRMTIVQRKVDGVVHTKGRFWVRQSLLDEVRVAGVFDAMERAEKALSSNRN
jgi:hypothetical protein